MVYIKMRNHSTFDFFLDPDPKHYISAMNSNHIAFHLFLHITVMSACFPLYLFEFTIILPKTLTMLFLPYIHTVYILHNKFKFIIIIIIKLYNFFSQGGSRLTLYSDSPL